MINKQILGVIILFSIMSFTMVFSEGGDSIPKADKGVEYGIEQPLGWQAFADATTFMMREYTGKVVIDSPDDTYSNGRVIVKVKEGLLQLMGYDPVMVIRDEDDHYLVQFLSSGEASDFASAMETLPDVEYVESDQSVWIDPESNNGNSRQ